MALIAVCALPSCGEEKHSTIADVDPETFPTMLTSDVSTLVSDSGYTRYHITTDLWLMYDEASDPHWTFPTGLDMEKYDNDMRVDATFVCDSAVYYSNRRLWEFVGNVRMLNTAGDRFATQILFWDQNARKVYSDSFIHIERLDRTLEGYGFESNESMTAYTINHPTGIFPVNPDARRQQSAAAAPADSIAPDSASAAPVIGRAGRQARRAAATTPATAHATPRNDADLRPVKAPARATSTTRPRPVGAPARVSKSSEEPLQATPVRNVQKPPTRKK
ncbi:MAG: LPS export ABC transporter periplasmic protein LptC [Muribaculaceae bacterium]|nr:LPS export ABC transporter periplasmic protein LptC [Muribaculaceae bacterium]